VSRRPPRGLLVAAGSLYLATACAPGPPPRGSPAPAPAIPDATAVAVPEPGKPVLPPQAAMSLGLLPRHAIGADRFIAAHREHDGRGVLIAILDSGIDAGLPGLRRTTTGDRKLADLRDFSGEGHVALTRVTPDGDSVTVHGRRLGGVGRIARLALPPYYVGTLDEAPLGTAPAADLNGDGDTRDRLPLVVAKASDGWFVMADTDGDGSLADEAPVRDYATATETFSFGPITLAANFGGSADRPTLDLFFDSSGHGSHVAGIAAGHDLFGVPGFDGIAPGARLLGLKIANNARGGVSVTGAMLRALAYAADYAARGGQPLVVNLSYGVGNDAAAGPAIIDSLLDVFALEHPDVTVVISAGNDGPGLSTIEFPGSAAFALSACALFPGVFAKPPRAGARPPDDVIGWWSSRGGRLPKPDLCVPGVAYSNVPPWDAGEEVAGGTSMAAPQLSGAVALLQSAMVATGAPPATAAQLTAALKSTASPVPGSTVLDAGAGVPNVGAAWRWLVAGHRAGRFAVRALSDGGNAWADAAYRRDGLADASDTVQRFTVASLVGQPFARLLLRPDAPWLHAPDALEMNGAPDTVALTYDAGLLSVPGLHVGTVWARPASDSGAGAAFALTNTVVVPYALDRPLDTRQAVKPGQTARFFLRVPAAAGGLAVAVHATDPDQHASLYLFEPAGRPVRDVGPAELGGELADSARLEVRQDDLPPGVYEAVLVAPPTEAATIELTAALAPLRITTAPAGGALVNGSPDTILAAVDARMLGVARRAVIGGRGSERRTVPVRIPEWADTLMLDVAPDAAVWRRVTDFAVSLWDSAGSLVSEMPLEHREGRAYIPIDSAGPHDVVLELLPAFALAADSTEWTADVTVAFFRSRPSRFLETEIVVPPQATVSVPWDVPAFPALDGFAPFVEVAARPRHGPATILRVILPPAMAAGGAR
jgi:tripeptidyl-peptidase-2